MIRRFQIEHDSDNDCPACGCPLFVGEYAYADDATGVIGCSAECCQDAALQEHDDRECAEYHMAFGEC